MGMSLGAHQCLRIFFANFLIDIFRINSIKWGSDVVVPQVS